MFVYFTSPEVDEAGLKRTDSMVPGASHPFRNHPLYTKNVCPQANKIVVHCFKSHMTTSMMGTKKRARGKKVLLIVFLFHMRIL